MNEYPLQNYQPPQEPKQPFNEPPPQPYQQQQYPQQPFTQYPPDTVPPPAPPPRKKRGPLFWAVLTVGIIVALIICGNAWNAAVSSQVSNTTATQPQATQAPDLGATAMAGNTPITSQPTQAAPTDTPAPTQAPATWKTTHSFTGSGIKKTAIFMAPDDWKITWSCDPSSFYGSQYNVQVYVYSSDNTPTDVAVNEICKNGNTSGDTEEHQGGDVYLEINSEGSWKVQVQELQ